MISADCYTRIGSHHPICEDYSYAGVINQLPVSIVSDGCSSAKETDWGARLLTNALKQQFNTPCNLGLVSDYHAAIRVAESNCHALQIPVEALTATLLTVKKVTQVDKSETLDACVAGDGFVIARRRADKILKVTQFEFSTNAPFYLRYSIDQNASRLYKERFGKGSLLKKTWDQLGGTVEYNILGEIAMCDAPLIHTLSFPIEEYDLVAVLSDGLHSFLIKELARKSLNEALLDSSKIIEQLFDFKSFAGQFVQRRCKAAFEKFQELGWGNYDDFSMGAIYHG